MRQISDAYAEKSPQNNKIRLPAMKPEPPVRSTFVILRTS